MNYAKVLHELFSRYDGPRFSLRLWDGKECSYGTGEENEFTLVIDDEATVQRLLAQGALGFGEAYMEGKLRVEGSLEAYLRLRHRFKPARFSLRLALAAFISRLRVPYDRKKQIAYHYDLGTDFFRLILDPETMSYSAGRFETGNETLPEAQLKKLKLVGEWLRVSEGSSVLDLGFGWGGFARYAAEQLKLNVTGYTLSNAQLEYSRKLVEEAGLEERVSFQYRDMVNNFPSTPHDAIVMLESIEHVGKKRLPAFFRRLGKALKPNGTLYIQTTGRYVPHRVDGWTLKYVFPGGYLPAKDELIAAAIAAGFRLEEFRDDTPDYIRTMAEWITNLERNRAIIEEKFGPSFYRLWELWMHGAKVAFEVDAMSLFRMRFSCIR